MKESKVIYEPHPVSPERKAELRAQGFTIIDAIYAPTDVVEKPDTITPEAIDTMPRKDVVGLLEAHGVEGATGKLADLRRWLKRVMFTDF